MTKTKSVTRITNLIVLFVAMFLQISANAASNNGLVYHGRITKTDGKVLAASGTVTIQIYGNSNVYWNGSAVVAGTEKCLLYQEIHSIDTTLTDGAFEVIIGQGSVIGGSNPKFPASATASEQYISNIFKNYPYATAPTTSGFNIPAHSCVAGSGGVYIPFGSSASVFQMQWMDRELVAIVNAGGATLSMPAMSIQALPWAMQAAQLNGFSTYNLFKINGSSDKQFTATQHDFLWSLAGLGMTTSASTLDANGNTITGLANPVAVSDAATKGYVDSQLTSFGAPISGLTGDVTATGPGTVAATLSNTGVSAGTYGSATNVGTFTVDAKGRLSAASNVAITGVAPGGAAGGDLTGSFYPNPLIASNAVTTAKINDGAITTAKLFTNPGINRLVMTDGTTGATLVAKSCSSGELLTWSGTGWACTAQSILSAAPTGAAGGDLTGTYPNPTLGTSGVTAGTYGSAVNIPVVTVDAKGRVTSASNVALDSYAFTSLNPASISGAVPVSKGGTGLSALGTSDQLLGVNNAGSAAEYKSLIAGAGVSIVSSAGSITISATGGTVTSVTAGTGLTGGTITGVGTLAVDVGTTAGQIVQVQALGKLPALDGFSLTGLNPANISGVVGVAKGGTGVGTVPTNGKILIGNGTGYTLTDITAGSGVTITSGAGSLSIAATGSGGTVTQVNMGTGVINNPFTVSGTIAVDVGTSVGQIVQVQALGKLPALDGSLLTGLNPANISGSVPVSKGGTGSTTALTGNKVMRSSGSAIVESAVLQDDGTNVGVGGAPTANIKMDVTGQIRSGSTGTAVSAIDFSAKGNVVVLTTAVDCSSTIALTNMQPGAQYTVIVQNTAATTACTFSDAGTNITSYIPANGTRLSGKRTIYQFNKISATAGDVMASWVPGFN